MEDDEFIQQVEAAYADRIITTLITKWGMEYKHARDVGRDIFYSYVLPIYELGGQFGLKPLNQIDTETKTMKSKTDNELIAEFMEAKPCKIDVKSIGVVDGYECDNFKLPIDELEYNSSWDWIMPVVDKIENMDGFLNIVAFDFSGCRIKVDGLTHDIAIDTLGGNSKLDSVYKAVVLFIKWYNENIKP